MLPQISTSSSLAFEHAPCRQNEKISLVLIIISSCIKLNLLPTSRFNNFKVEEIKTAMYIPNDVMIEENDI